MPIRWFLAIVFFAPERCLAAPAQTTVTVPLIQAINSPTVPSSTGLPIFVYLTDGLGWLQEIAVGMVILWMVISGTRIMLAGNDQTKRGEAKESMIAAIIGLLMLFLLGFILSVLNANFFLQ